MWSSWEEISTFDDNIEHNQKKFESIFRSCRRTPPSRNNILEYPGMNISTMNTRVNNNISRCISFVLHKKSSSSLSVIQREESPRLCSVMGCCKVYQRSVRTTPRVYLDEKQEWRNHMLVVLVSCCVIVVTTVVVLIIISSSWHRTLFLAPLSNAQKKKEQKK